MLTLTNVPNGLSQIKAVYGDPDANGDFVLDQA